MPDNFTVPVVKRGDRGKNVRLAQEWLTFHGFGTALDSDFGPATELSTKSFQTKKSLPATGDIDLPTQSALLAPINGVQKPIAVGSKTLPELYIAYARQHLKEHPVEVGGQNRGPWVRFYMQGNEGDAWLWCAGFVTWVLRQACRGIGQPMPHPYNFSCDTLAMKAKSNGLFLPVNNSADLGRVKPGYLVVYRKAANNWSHIGIVESIFGEAMTTIEGNTDHAGSQNGFEVCRQNRRMVGKDYLVVE